MAAPTRILLEARSAKLLREGDGSSPKTVGFKPLLFSFLLIFIQALFPWQCGASSRAKTLERPREVTRVGSGRIEMCLSCHFEEPDRAHSREAAGCWSCHLGNPLAGETELAHEGMVLNPGDLRHVELTCGRSGCHPKEAKDIKKTLMATNRGIIATLRYYWGEEADNRSPLTVEDLMSEKAEASPALDYFRKLCGTCHLWLPRHFYPGFLGEKGGGCTACHNSPAIPEGEASGQGKGGYRHPRIVRTIPLENCVRCHNRSGRIGLSYQGKYESEGYGTPFEEADLSANQLADGRFVWEDRTPDVHYKAGMVCTDCHTKREAMGDGKEHAHLEEQLETTCQTCHTGQEQLEELLSVLGRPDSALPRITGLVEEDGTVALKAKATGKKLPLKPPSNQCATGLHQRLSCQACHSPWVPQCYGCHVRADGSQSQLDKLSGQETPGLWQEFRSFIRYETPSLGVRERRKLGAPKDEKVVVLVPG